MATAVRQSKIEQENLVQKIRALRNMHATFEQELKLLEYELDTLLANINTRLDQVDAQAILADIKKS